MVEVLVSFMLLVTIISLSTPMIIANQRMIQSQRRYRLALDELSNQLDRLTSLSGDELSKALEQIAPSEFVKVRLSGAKISSKSMPSDWGERITLQITWKEVGREENPLRMSAWRLAPPTSLQRKGAQE